jgi:PPOX class probable F420-dependent enzyme
MIFDSTTQRGLDAVHRLDSETLAWLTTSHPDGRLSSSLIWFLWRDQELVIYSRDNAKVRNIAANPHVAFNLNSDDNGGSVLTIEGTARIDRNYPPSDQIDAYTEKYDSRIEGLGTTPEGFAADYSVPIRITPTSYRAW